MSWTLCNYFSDLLNSTEEVNHDNLNPPDSEHPGNPPLISVDAPTVEEVQEAINQLRSGKYPGPDNIPAEILKDGGLPVTMRLHELITDCWAQEEVPQDWKDATIVTIFKKKGSHQDCNNYRGISLLSVVGKVMYRVTVNRLSDFAECVVPESQCGFRKNCSTIDQIFSIRQIQEKCTEQQRLKWLRCRLSFSLLRSAITAIRGTRTPARQNSQPESISLAMAEGNIL